MGGARLRRRRQQQRAAAANSGLAAAGDSENSAAAAAAIASSVAAPALPLPPPSPPAPSLCGGSRVPNLWWGAVDDAAFRACPRVLALPPEGELRLAGPPSFRLVRQATPTWARLHAGVLTSSVLKGFLGFFERGPAALLGLPRGVVGPGPFLQALQVLGEPGAWPLEGGEATQDAAAAHNAAACQRFNAARAAAPAEGPLPASRVERAKAAAARGIGAVRCAWGAGRGGGGGGSRHWGAPALSLLLHAAAWARGVSVCPSMCLSLTPPPPSSPSGQRRQSGAVPPPPSPFF